MASTLISIHTDLTTAVVVANLFILNQLLMAKQRTTSRKIIHSLPCGCECIEVTGKKPFWERCFKAELLAEQFGMGNITLNDYSKHFHYDKQADSIRSGW